MERLHAGAEVVHRLTRHRLGKHRRQQRTYERPRRAISQCERLTKALLGDLVRQRTGPARVCRRQDQSARHGGVSPLERKGEDAAERQSGNTRSVETQRPEESGEAVGVAI
jgi:hypothetical protein